MSETPDTTTPPDGDTPPTFHDVIGLPPEADDNGKVADQTPVVDTEVRDDTEEVLPTDTDDLDEDDAAVQA